jgi:Domain of unknown function (DUF4157)/Novel toxin 16
MQAKLEIGAANDPLEAEADRVANLVVRTPVPLPPLARRPGTVSLRRRCAACEGEKELEKDGLRLQPKCEACAGEERQERAALHKGVPAEGDVAASVSDVLASPGRHLDAPTLGFFEPRFNHDFSRVRVHTDAAAANSSRAVGALAYTVGSDIVFARNRFEPTTLQGRTLLAHELAHVVQQGGVSGTGADALHVSPSSRKLQRREICDENGVCRSEPGPDQSTSRRSAEGPKSSNVTAKTIVAAGAALFAPGDCTQAEHAALQADVDNACNQSRACLTADSCPVIEQKMAANQDCIKARLKINMKCFRGGDPGHVTALMYAVLALINCQAIFSRKCRPPPPPPITVPQPETEKKKAPENDEEFMKKMERLTGLTGTALIIYLIISEGSRLFPPRNLIPAP